MTKKFICNECGTPCILKVDGIDISDVEIYPTECPFLKNGRSHWIKFIEE